MTGKLALPMTDLISHGDRGVPCLRCAGGSVLFFLYKNLRNFSWKGKRAEKKNAWNKGKKVRTTSDDADGKSVCEKSKSAVAKCVIKNSTGGWNLVWEDLCGNKLGMLKQEYKTRWSSTQNMILSLMKFQESIHQQSFPTWPEWLDGTWQYLPLLCLLRDSSVVWDLYRWKVFCLVWLDIYNSVHPCPRVL